MFSWGAPLTVLTMIVMTVASAAQLRTPTRLSAEGLYIAADRLGNRYHPVIPWEQVGRIWTDGPTLRIRLHDPDAAAGANLSLAARMRHRRSLRAADLMEPLVKDHRTVEDAVTRFSGGRLRLERAHVDPVPGTYDVAIRDNRALPLLIILLMLLGTPWMIAMASLGSSYVLYTLSFALAVTTGLAPIGLRLAGPLVAPHIIAPDGLRVRVVHPLAHDLAVPWARVDRIWHSRHGRRPILLVRVADPDALTGGDARLRSRLRSNRARFDADLVIPTGGAGMDAAYLSTAVAHRSSGARRLEYVA